MKQPLACLPTQTIGDTYDAALNARRSLVEPDAVWFWTRSDMLGLAHDILGDMLVAPKGGGPLVETWRTSEDHRRGEVDPDVMDLDEDLYEDDLDDDDMSYEVTLSTRIGKVVGFGSCWAFAMARALAAYQELRVRSALTIAPIAQAPAFEFIDRIHRHHAKPPGWKFGLGAWAVINDVDTLVGVATVGRPTSRVLQDQGAWEVQRMAVLEGGQNLCSALYAACWREARKRGNRRLVTFILPTESGNSLKAAGWTLVKQAVEGKQGAWGRGGRPRKDKAPTCDKQRWEASPPKG